MRAWAAIEDADSIEDARIGLGPQWIEIDGRRFTDAIISFAYTTRDGDSHGDGASFGVLTLDLNAAVEVVLVDRDGNVLESTDR
jgi:hypothetical protein